MSEPKSKFTTVKLDREVAQLCKAAASLDGKDLSAWIADILRPIAEKRLARPVVKRPREGDE